jgi:hypothetical protein
VMSDLLCLLDARPGTDRTVCVCLSERSLSRPLEHSGTLATVSKATAAASDPELTLCLQVTRPSYAKKCFPNSCCFYTLIVYVCLEKKDFETLQRLDK